MMTNISGESMTLAPLREASVMMLWKPATPLVPRSAAGYRLSALRAWRADTNAISLKTRMSSRKKA